MYQEIIPSNKIRHRIESFWVFKGSQNTIDFKVLPDSCIDLIFDLNKNKIFISGIMTRYQFRNLGEYSNLLGLRMKAEWLPYLSKTAISDFKNARVEITDLKSFANSSLWDALCESNSLMDKMNFIEKLMMSEHMTCKKFQDKLIIKVANEIRKSKGNIAINELAKTNFISLRQLERRFKKYIGTTLKEFSNIVKFHNTKRFITNNKELSLLQIAFEMGYYDHAHMNNHFKRIADEYPSAFR